MNVSRVFTGIFMLVISLAFLGAGVWMQFYRLSGYEPVQARITKIETTTNHSTSNKHSKRSHRSFRRVGVRNDRRSDDHYLLQSR